MIFPNVSKADWIKKHPGLTSIEVECLECHGQISTDQPFVTKDYVGLSASKCPHCNTSHKAYTGVPYSPEEIEAWYPYSLEVVDI